MSGELSAPTRNPQGLKSRVRGKAGSGSAKTARQRWPSRMSNCGAALHRFASFGAWPTCLRAPPRGRAAMAKLTRSAEDGSAETQQQLQSPGTPPAIN